VTRTQVFGFEWGFLDEIARWALGVGILASAAGVVYTHDAAFAVACMIATALDVVLVAVSVRRARHGLEVGHIDPVAPLVMLAGRLVVKAGLLLVAMLTHNAAAFWGAVAGVMVFDVTLAFGGSVIAISRGMQTPREGR